MLLLTLIAALLLIHRFAMAFTKFILPTLALASAALGTSSQNPTSGMIPGDSAQELDLTQLVYNPWM